MGGKHRDEGEVTVVQAFPSPSLHISLQPHQFYSFSLPANSSLRGTAKFAINAFTLELHKCLNQISVL